MEASSKRLEVAITIDNQICFERAINPTEVRTSTSALTPFLGEALQAANLKPDQIDILALTIGPGSFTSLRIACVTAKTWSYVTQCRLVAIPTHDIVARQNLEEARQRQAKKIWVLTDAQRRQLFVTAYEITKDDEKLAMNKSETLILDPIEWETKLAPCDVVAGTGIKLVSQHTTANLCNEENWLPWARTVAELAKERAELEEFDDLWKLSPLYVRLSAAEEKQQNEVSNQDQK